jgi:hypothetical protein
MRTAGHEEAMREQEVARVKDKKQWDDTIDHMILSGDFDIMRKPQVKKVEDNDDRRDFGRELSQASSRVSFDIDKHGDVMIKIFDRQHLLKYVMHGSMVDWDIVEYVEE